MREIGNVIHDCKDPEEMWMNWTGVYADENLISLRTWEVKWVKSFQETELFRGEAYLKIEDCDRLS